MTRPDDATPLLTVAVPTYRRVDLLRRCLQSVRPTRAGTSERIELVVSDNSPAADTDVERLVEDFHTDWPATLRYDRNPEGTGAVNNFNLCIQRARGRYTLILHDDDYLLPGAIDQMVDVLADAGRHDDRVLLFGVRVEDLDGTIRRRQTFRRGTRLSPADAYERLLSDSSFVRVPGLVVATAAYRDVGGFRVDAHTACDVDMSVRLFGRYGVRCVPGTAAAYTVHHGGVTTTVFTPRTLRILLDIFDRARRMGVIDDARVTRLQRRWFHRFVLAGTWRALRRGDRAAARQAFALFHLPELRALGVSLRWLPVRLAFAVLVHAPSRRRRSRPEGWDRSTAAQGSPTADGRARTSGSQREW